MKLRFDADYREQAPLRDGEMVELRVVQPRDRELLREGFARLSPESRFLRFFAAKSALSEEELRYLTELDGMRHFAIGAVRSRDGGEEGVGIARFVRESPDAPVAEAALAVLDELHGRGLGKLLLARLVAAARERGVTRFSCDVLAGNEPMQALLRDLAGAATTVREPGVLHVTFPLPDELPQTSIAYRLLKLAAERLLPLRRWLDR